MTDNQMHLIHKLSQNHIVSTYSWYVDGAPGFVIEEYDERQACGYSLPDWEERGLPELQGPFETVEAAKAAFASVYLCG